MLKNLSQNTVRVTCQGAFAQLRPLSVYAPILKAQERRHKKVYAELEKHTNKIQQLQNEPETKKLQAEQKKIHKNLSKLKKDEEQALKDLAKKVKDKQQALDAKHKEASEKLVKLATRSYRALNNMSVFIKEKAGSGKTLPQLAEEWKGLSDIEKDYYKEIANKLNEANRKLWTPEPKAPARAYATFVKENYPHGLDFSDASKQLSQTWKTLSEEEKAKYNPTREAIEEHARLHKEWVEKRVETYLALKANKQV